MTEAQKELAAKLLADQGQDFKVTYHGSVSRLVPLTDLAKEWVEEHLQLEDWQWMGPAIVIDTRYIGDIIDGIIDDGLAI